MTLTEPVQFPDTPRDPSRHTNRDTNRDTTDAGDGPGRVVRAVLVAAVVAPIVVAVVRALAHHYIPLSDDALLFIRAADVGTRHHPWLGSWTSASLSVGENMNNPGPIYQDLIAPFAKIFSPGPAAAIGVGAVNAAVVVAISATARRIGGWGLQRWMLVATAALTWTMGSELLYDIWQAHALMLPFLWFLVLLLGATVGRTWCIPWAVGVASLLVQTHISYAYILALITPVAVVIYALDHRPLRFSRAALTGGTAVTSYVVFLVLWLQPFIEELFGAGRGNLTRLASNAGGGSLHLGFQQGASITAAIVALPPWWLRSGFTTTVPITAVTQGPHGQQIVVPGLPSTLAAVGALAVLLALLVGLAWLAHRSGLALQARACAVAAVCVAATVVALGMLTVGIVGFAPHHIRFLWPLAIFVQMVALWTALALVSLHIDNVNWHRSLDAVAVATMLLLVGLNLSFDSQLQGPVADTAAVPALRRVFRDLEPLRAEAPVVFDVSNLRPFEAYSATVMMRLQQLGIEFRVSDEGMVRQLGDNRRATGHEKARIFQLQGSDALLYDGPACTISLASALTPDAEAAAREQAATIAGWLADGSITIDTSRIVGADAAMQSIAQAALAGDTTSALRIEYGGDLERWLEQGIARADDPETLDATLRPVMAYGFSAYGLFSDQQAPCP